MKRVGAQVVVNLILDMRRLGHPSYAGVDEAAVRRRAEELPENGVMPEVLKVMQEATAGMEDKLQPQKAATPCDGKRSLEEAGEAFAAQRPRAVVAEGYANARREAHEVEVAALADLQQKLAPEGLGLPTFEVRTGNQLVDQFRPSYFAAAFPFCFKYGTARPDVRNISQDEERAKKVEAERRRLRRPEAPTLDVHDWAAAMARRVETQFRRDWTFASTVWNYLFRTMVNLQPNAYIYAVPEEDGSGRQRMLTNEEICAGARELMGALRVGKYVDIAGELKAIQGDFTKLRHAPALSAAAKKLLSNAEARARSVPGTHEVRKTMRHQTHANRVCYGTAAFVTFSPSERDTALMVKLARARQSDPAIAADGSGPFQQRDKPELDVDYARLSPEAFVEDCGLQLLASRGDRAARLQVI
ncbi:hypothetical protein [Pyruvatibacter mobilis]|uniref:hypothetical protein n=1 Tax=Pyruvatibacter mobilis TaxID=1712261 RepID=UPI003BAADF6B